MGWDSIAVRDVSSFAVPAAGLAARLALLAVAAVLLPAAGELRSRVRAWLDGLIVGGSLLFLSWPTWLGPAHVGARAAFPVADVVLATVALSTGARMSGRVRWRPLLLAASLVGCAVGEMAPIGWGVAALLLAVAALAPGGTCTARATRATSALPFLPLTVAATGALASGVAGAGIGGVETTIGASVVLLVVVRHLLAAADDARLARSLEDAMRDAQDREEHFRSLVAESSDVLTICDADGTVRFISPALHRVFGYRPEEMLGTPVVAKVHPDDHDRMRAEVRAARDEPGDPIVLTCRYQHADGRWVDVETVLTNHLDHPSIAGLVFNTRDVSERRDLERQLTHQAYHDPLTGLANRSLFRDRVRHALALRTRSRRPLAVLFLDLDGFKAINDTLGHSSGDRLLGSVAGRVQSVLRPGDTVARLGGDEFAILLEDLDGLHTAQHVARRIIDGLHEAIVVDGREVFVGVSIGLALAGTKDDADTLLRNADLAMYRAKALGKNRCEVFEAGMHQAAIERMAIEGDLRHAVARGELRLHYQPIVELGDGRIVGVEALLRWAHPERGLVGPAEFIGVAEESGLIVPIGRWVVSEACRQVARWQRETGVPLRLSVNISARQLQAPRLAEHVARTLRTTGLRAEDLVLEITESMLVDDAERTIAKLHLLRELGVRLAVDDFGTGYSSLNYLRRLPVDVLKIDRSFVNGVAAENELAALTGAIVRIGRDLGLDTVAEGIEDHEQLAALRAMGCVHGQGFLYARPLPADDLAELLYADDVIDLAEATA